MPHITVVISRKCPGDQIEKNDMVGACSTHWGEMRFIQGFGEET